MFHNAFDDYVDYSVHLLTTQTTTRSTDSQSLPLLIRLFQNSQNTIKHEIEAFYSKYPCCIVDSSAIFAKILMQFPDSVHSIIASIVFGGNMSSIDDCLWKDCNLTKDDCIQLKKIQKECQIKWRQKLTQNTNKFRIAVKNQQYWNCFVCGKRNISAMEARKQDKQFPQQLMSCDNKDCPKKGLSLNPFYFALKNKFYQFEVEKEYGVALCSIVVTVKFNSLAHCNVYISYDVNIIYQRYCLNNIPQTLEKSHWRQTCFKV